MDGVRDVVIATRICNTGVDTHPYPGYNVAVPRHGGQSPLSIGTRAYCGLCIAEGHEAGVTFGLHDVAVVRLPGLAEKLAVPVEERRVRVTQITEHPRRTLDIGEDEGDDTSGQPGGHG
jgi:hypothetical protein